MRHPVGASVFGRVWDFSDDDRVLSSADTKRRFFLVVFLDYLLAYGVYGTANVFYKRLQKSRTAVVVSGSIALLLRYACHILSGILIWGGYAAPGQSVLAYSIGYNGSYMIPETILTAVVLAGSHRCCVVCGGGFRERRQDRK